MSTQTIKECLKTWLIKTKQRFSGLGVTGLLFAVALPCGYAQAMVETSYVSNGYLVELLPTPVVGTHLPMAINASGVVVGIGDSGNGEGVNNAVMWSADGTYSNLTPSEPDFYSVALGVNAAGDVAGDFEDNPVIWINGQKIFLGGAASGFGDASDINDNGEVVGDLYNTVSTGFTAFIYKDGVATELARVVPGGDTTVSGINEIGQISGSASIVLDGPRLATVWTNGVPSVLGALPIHDSSFASDINDVGQAVGRSYLDGTLFQGTPVIWQGGTVQSLGSMGGDNGGAAAINNAGQVVGFSEDNTPPYGLDRAFIWQNGVMTDLTPILGGLCSGASNCGDARAVDINNAGQIVGRVDVPGTVYDAVYRLTPVTGNELDLAVGMSASADVVNVGDQLDYSITLTNTSSTNGSGVSVVDSLPAGLDLVSATPSQGGCSGTSTVICDLGNLGAGGVATVDLSVTANSAGVFTNTVDVNANEVETDLNNNMVSHTVDVQDVAPPPPPPSDADMEVKLAVSSKRVRVGDRVTYTATVTNKGPALATSVEVSDALPSSLAFVSANASQGSCSGGSTVSCTLGDMSANSSAVVDVVVTVIQRERRLTNSVTVQSQSADPDGGNNSDSVRIRVRR